MVPFSERPEDRQMVERTPFVVAYVERRPTPGRHFSIERVFDAVSASSPPQVEIRRTNVPCSGVSPRTLLRNTLAARSVRADVIHVTGDVHYVLPLLPRRVIRVLTIHDLASLNRTTGLRRRIIRWLWFSWPLEKADAVTTVSEETRRQLITEFGDVAGKVTVVENPLTSPFADVQPAQMRAPHDQNSFVVLAVGAGVNKNLPRTAEAVRRVGASLRIIGKLDADNTKRLVEIGVSYEAVHTLSDDDLLTEYLNADVLVFPSLNEGFGLPILEAQAVGLPVVTSNVPPMCEVAAGGALLVDPHQPSEIADAIMALRQDSDLRDRLRAAGLENVRRHSAYEIAEGYARLYRRLLCTRDKRSIATPSAGDGVE